MFREIKKEDFSEYLRIRKKGLKEIKKITKEQIDISEKNISKEFKDFF